MVCNTRIFFLKVQPSVSDWRRPHQSSRGWPIFCGGTMSRAVTLRGRASGQPIYTAWHLTFSSVRLSVNPISSVTRDPVMWKVAVVTSTSRWWQRAGTMLYKYKIVCYHVMYASSIEKTEEFLAFGEGTPLVLWDRFKMKLSKAFTPIKYKSLF